MVKLVNQQFQKSFYNVSFVALLGFWLVILHQMLPCKMDVRSSCRYLTLVEMAVVVRGVTLSVI